MVVLPRLEHTNNLYDLFRFSCTHCTSTATDILNHNLLQVNRPNSRFRELMAAQLSATHPAESVDRASEVEDVVEEEVEENGESDALGDIREVNERTERESVAEIRA